MIEFLADVAIMCLMVQDGKICDRLNIKHLIFFPFSYCFFVIYEGF